MLRGAGKLGVQCWWENVSKCGLKDTIPILHDAFQVLWNMMPQTCPEHRNFCLQLLLHGTMPWHWLGCYQCSSLSLWDMQSLGQHGPHSVVGVCLSFLRPHFQSRLSHGLGQSCGQEWVGIAILKKQFILLGLCTVRAQSCCLWRFCSCYCSIGRLQIQFTLQELQSGRNVWLGHPAV